MRALLQRRLAAVLASVLFASTLLASAAGAAPIDAKKAEAARLQRQLEAEGQRVSVLAEQYNSAKLKVEATRSAADNAAADLAKANAQFDKIRDRMAAHAIDVYVHGGQTATIEHLLRGTGDDVIARRQYLNAAAADGRRAMDDLRVAREDLAEVRARNQAAQRDAGQTAAPLGAKKSAADKAVAAQKATLSRVNGELSQLISADQARRDAELASRSQPRLASKAAAKGVSLPLKPPPPLSSKAAIAVQVAKEQIGKPYVYGGSGPDSFDCSGLVMYAWGRAGVSLPHSATAQYYATTRINFSDLQPGDLVFFYNDIHHVAMYVGGGQLVEATQTGTPVKYSSASRGPYYGAGRVNA